MPKEVSANSSSSRRDGPAKREPLDMAHDSVMEDSWSRRVNRFARWERRVLLGSTLTNCAALLLMVVAISTEYWIVIEFVVHKRPGINASAQAPLTPVKMRAYTGIWRTCSAGLSQDISDIKHCALSEAFMEEDHVSHDLNVDATLLNYSRSEVAFAIISVVLMVIGAIFSVYTILQPNFMMKRLCAFLHVTAGITALILAEVFMNGVAYEQEHVPLKHPEKSIWYYGFSFTFVWIVMAVHMMTGVIFFLYSKISTNRSYSFSKRPNDDYDADIAQMV